MANQKIVDCLGDKASYYLDHQCKTINKNHLHLPSPDNIEKVWMDSNRNIPTLRKFTEHFFNR
jgi:class I fructose-bisphosphate aldolase